MSVIQGIAVIGGLLYFAQFVLDFWRAFKGQPTLNQRIITLAELTKGADEAFIEALCGVEKSMRAYIKEKSAYASGIVDGFRDVLLKQQDRLDEHDSQFKIRDTITDGVKVALNDHASRIDKLGDAHDALNERLVALEIEKPHKPVEKESDLDPASSWQRQRQRAEAGNN